MKLLTLNTHSLQEEDYEQKLEWFIEGILQEKPDIIALQEVNQTAAEAMADNVLWEGQCLLPAQVPLKQDNYAAQVYIVCVRQELTVIGYGFRSNWGMENMMKELRFLALAEKSLRQIHSRSVKAEIIIAGVPERYWGYR